MLTHILMACLVLVLAVIGLLLKMLVEAQWSSAEQFKRIAEASGTWAARYTRRKRKADGEEE